MTAEEKWKALEEFVCTEKAWCKTQEDNMLLDGAVESAIRMNVRARTHGIVLLKMQDLDAL